MLSILFSLLCIKYIFFWFYPSVRFKANVEYTEKGITSAMECADVAGFTFVYVTNNMVFHLHVYVGRSDGH